MCLLVIALAAVLCTGLLFVVAKQINQRMSLNDKLQPLLDRGELDPVIQQSRERLMTFPDDATAHYYLGMALQRQGDVRQALVHLRRVAELNAGWEVSTLVAALERRLQAGEGSGELRVVQGVAAANPAAAPHE